MDWELLKTFGERFNYLLSGRSSLKVESETGVSNSLITLYRKGKGNPTADKLEKLIEVYGEWNLNWLFTGEGEPYNSLSSTPDKDLKYIESKIKTVPVVGSVPCGVPVQSWDIDDNKLLKLADVGHLQSPFILTAKGDSMSPYINNKDLLLCADMPEKVLKNGKAVVVSFNADPESFNANAKLIKWQNKKKEVMLYSVNTKYEPEIYQLKDIYKIYKVVRIIREVN